MKKIILLLTLFLAVFSKAQTDLNSMASLAYSKAPKSVQVKYSIYVLDKDLWGFTIFMGDIPMMHNSGIPGLEKIKGYKSREVAEQLAAYVTYKITYEPYPFKSITKEDLRNAGIEIEYSIAKD